MDISGALSCNLGRTHSKRKNEDGLNRSKDDTSRECDQCRCPYLEAAVRVSARGKFCRAKCTDWL